jgi:DNA-directed RNA polymerase subunit L
LEISNLDQRKKHYGGLVASNRSVDFVDFYLRMYDHTTCDSIYWQLGADQDPKTRMYPEIENI